MTVVEIPGSKSITNRALFVAAAAAGRTTLGYPLASDDSAAFTEGLRALGYQVDTTDPTCWAVQGRAGGPAVDRASVFGRDAATASRFLPALASLGSGTFDFDASAQMRRRPVGPLVDALRSLGVEVRYGGEPGHLPFQLATTGIDGGELSVDAGLSSQFLTAILMLGPSTRQGLQITVPDLVSQPYIGITRAVMRAFGVEVSVDGSTYRVPAKPYQPGHFDIEPDASTASYFFALAALLGEQITVPRLGQGSRQGDREFVRVLEQMGAEVTEDEVSTTVRGSTVRGRCGLGGVTVNMRDISDTMPTLAAIAPFADGPVRIEDVYNTRVKECDRLAACAENLERMGISVTTGRDWIEIQPGVPQSATIACHGDHRIAMAFSIAGLRVDGGVILDDPGCVKKTFPEFHQVLAEVLTQLG